MKVNTPIIPILPTLNVSVSKVLKGFLKLVRVFDLLTFKVKKEKMY